MKFEEFFNPYNQKHVEAYLWLTRKYSWPEDFIPAYVVTSHLDVIIVQSKLAQAWALAVENHTDG